MSSADNHESLFPSNDDSEFHEKIATVTFRTLSWSDMRRVSTDSLGRRVDK